MKELVTNRREEERGGRNEIKWNFANYNSVETVRTSPKRRSEGGREGDNFCSSNTSAATKCANLDRLVVKFKRLDYDLFFWICKCLCDELIQCSDRVEYISVEKSYEQGADDAGSVSGRIKLHKVSTLTVGLVLVEIVRVPRKFALVFWMSYTPTHTHTHTRPNATKSFWWNSMRHIYLAANRTVQDHTTDLDAASLIGQLSVVYTLCVLQWRREREREQERGTNAFVEHTEPCPEAFDPVS